VALGAIGLALVYSIAEVPNFAHGELLMLGAYAALFVNQPGTVPLFDLLATGTQSVGPAGLAVLFVLGAGATLGAVYLLGGWDALRGGWWPVDVPPALAVAVHVVAAALVGTAVVVGTPSIWAGLLLAAVLLAVVAPLFEKYVFAKFRVKDASLATMLIVALGLSFVLRFGTQAIYGGQIRSYQIPRTVQLFGAELGLSAAKFFDFYLTNAGVVLDVIDTGPQNNPSILTAGYSWLAVAAVIVVTALVAVVAHRWRAGGAGALGTNQTVGPRLTGALAGLVVFVVLAAVLAGGASVPGTAFYDTRIRLSLMRAAVIVIAVLMMASLHVLLKQTKLGTAMRAASGNMDLAKVTGINTDRVMMATWIIAGSFAAVGGVMLGVLFNQVNVNMGFFLLLPMFAGVILGGIGSVYGAILGSFIVGLAMDGGIYLTGLGSVYRIPIAFVVLLVVLLVKPEGITGGA